MNIFPVAAVAANHQAYLRFVHFSDHHFGALKSAEVVQLQGARFAGMAHAISSVVQITILVP